MTFKEIIDSFTKTEIQSFLKKLKNTDYRSSWSKDKLVIQLLEYDTEEVLKTFTSNQLKECLKLVGKSTDGNKAILSQRLFNDLSKPILDVEEKKWKVQNPLLSINISPHAVGTVEFIDSWDSRNSDWGQELFDDDDRSHFIEHVKGLFYTGLIDDNVYDLASRFNLLNSNETPEAFFSNHSNVDKFIDFFRTEDKSKIIDLVCYTRGPIFRCVYEPYDHRNGCVVLTQTVRCTYQIWKEHRLQGDFILEVDDFVLRLKSTDISSGYRSNQINTISDIEIEGSTLLLTIQRGIEASPISVGDEIILHDVQAYTDSTCDHLSSDNEFNDTFVVQAITEDGVLRVLMPTEPLSVYPRGGWIVLAQEVLDEKHVYLDWK